MRTRKFVIGDIHGYYEEMIELFNRARFQYKRDVLISLGDLVDRGPQPLEVIETLMTVKKFIHILGNHDDWCFQYLKNNIKTIEWTSQGGENTIMAYEASPELRKCHIMFFEKAKLYFIDEKKRLFVHGGYNPRIPFQFQKENKDLLTWDRSLILDAIDYQLSYKTLDEFSEIYVGHTPTQFIGESTPIQIGNLWMLDTGIHLSGKLTMMDIETKEYWQSSPRVN